MSLNSQSVMGYLMAANPYNLPKPPRSGARYTCVKKYPHSLGWSSVFRQWRAKSHCNKLHGYALAFEFEFGCYHLDENGWVVDFGSLQPVKKALANWFDHKLLIAEDDPEKDHLRRVGHIADIRVFPGSVGVEAFARFAYTLMSNHIEGPTGCPDRAYVIRCTCSEHEANSATYWRSAREANPNQ